MKSTVAGGVARPCARTAWPGGGAARSFRWKAVGLRPLVAAAEGGSVAAV